MDGLHLTADCFDCTAEMSLFLEADLLSAFVASCVKDTGLTLVGEKYVSFSNPDQSPAGVTGTALLAESHVALHTWPELKAVTLDVYVCNFMQDNSLKARQLLELLIQRFDPARCTRQELQRGSPQPGLATEQLSTATHYRTQLQQRVMQKQSQFQQIEIADTRDFGRIMRIDQAMMTSEKDEFFYHENLVHPAAITHPEPKTALIIGGGDGGSSRQLLKHPSIERIVLCEIDEEVVSIAREYLPSIHQGALNDAKVEHVYADGFAYVQNSDEQFDLILLDLTDPLSPDGSSLAATCMTEDFFRQCCARLTTQGMLVMHLGSPFYHPQRYRDTLHKLAAAFPLVRPYSVFIPLYGAEWGMAVASMAADPLALTGSTVKQRIEHRGLQSCNYYNEQTHQALFAIPNYLRDLMPDQKI